MLKKIKSVESLNKKIKSKEMKTIKIKSFLNPILSAGIARKLIIAFILLSIIPLSVVGIFSYYNAANTVEKKVGFYSKQMVGQIALNINLRIEQFENISMMVLSNDELMNAVGKKTYQSPSEKNQDQSRVVKTLFSIAATDNNIRGMYIYKQDGTRFVSGMDKILDKMSDSSSNIELYNKFKEAIKDVGQKPVWVTGINDSYENIYLVRNLQNRISAQELGVLVISVSGEYINSILQHIELNDQSDVALLNENQNIIGYLNKERIGTKSSETYINKIYSAEQSGNFTHEGNVVSFGTTTNGWKVITKEPVASLMSEMKVVQKGVIFIVIVCIILAVSIGSFIALRISKPLKHIMNLMSKAEQGNLTVHSDIKTKDEISKLSHSFNKMIDNIRNLITETNNVVNEVERDTKIIRSSSEQSAAASEQVSVAINEMAEGSSEQAKQAEKGYQLMEDLANNINYVTTRIENIIQMLNHTESSRNHAVSTIETLNQKTKDAVKSSATINEEINELDKEAKEIITVINTIESISEQTNLLALNAAIEAARAGEAGKGFAVVAEEIRKLAMNSKDATGMISEIISRIQMKTEKTVEVVKSSDKIYDEQNKIVNETNIAFNEMSGSIRKVVEQIEDINTFIDVIQRKKNNSTEAMNNIVAIVEQSAASIEEVTATSEEQTSSSEQLAVLAQNLGQAIESLKKSISIFKI